MKKRQVLIHLGKMAKKTCWEGVGMFVFFLGEVIVSRNSVLLDTFNSKTYDSSEPKIWIGVGDLSFSDVPYLCVHPEQQ